VRGPKTPGERPGLLSMNPGGRSSEEMAPPSNSETVDSPRSNQSATTLKNGSSLSVTKECAKSEEKAIPPAVQIRLLGKEGGEKSIQTQLGTSVEVRLISEASDCMLGAGDSATDDETSLLVNGGGKKSRKSENESTPAQSKMTNGGNTIHSDPSKTTTTTMKYQTVSLLPFEDSTTEEEEELGEEEGEEEEGEIEDEIEGEDNNRNMSNMAVLANTSKLRSLCKLGYPDELDKFLAGLKNKPGALDLDVATEDGWTCLHDMITHECQFTQVAAVLIKHGANVNTTDLNGDSPLHSALLYHNTDNIKLLLEGGANTESLNNIGRRPIHIANDPESLSLLLDFNADFNAQDRVGNAAIHFAVLAKDKERVELLLSKGADITVRTRAGSTPLHLAAGDLAICQLLLDAKANPNSLDNLENSPLHLAVRGRHKDVVRSLISAKADATLSNTNGKSPLNLAKDKEMKHILLGKDTTDPATPSRKTEALNTSRKDSTSCPSPVTNGTTDVKRLLNESVSTTPQPSPVISSPSILKRKKMEDNRPHVGPRLRFSDVNDYSGVEDPVECGLPSKRVKVTPIYTDPPQFSDDED